MLFLGKTPTKQARPIPSTAEAILRGQAGSNPFDELLAQHRPFADSAYLHEQLHARYHQRLAKVAEQLPIAGALSVALERATPHRRYRTIGDPVVRNAIHQALRQVWHGAEVGQSGPGAPAVSNGLSLADCAEIFRETIEHLEGNVGGGAGGAGSAGSAGSAGGAGGAGGAGSAGGGGPLGSGGTALRRLGSEPVHGSFWTEDHRDDRFGRCFRRMVDETYPGAPLCAPSAADYARVAKGAELLGALMPLCARSVLSHTHVIVIVPHAGTWKKKGSCSEFRLSGTIFLNREMLESPWWVAEHLLHESLHQKLYDFRHTHSLLAEDLSPDWRPTVAGGAAVEAIWNLGGTTGANAWDTFRAIAAFHVYVHLAALAVQVERRQPELVKRFGPIPDGVGPATTKRREAFERAQYLGRRIKDRCWSEMGPAGRLFVAWLGSTLNALDPAPPARDSVYMHLVLQRYLLEGNAVASVDQKSPLPAERAGLLRALMNDEGRTIDEVLRSIGADAAELQQLSDASASHPDEPAAQAFARFRRCAAALLHTHSPGGYGLRVVSEAAASAPNASPDRTVQAMVDRSSERLLVVLDARLDEPRAELVSVAVDAVQS